MNARTAPELRRRRAAPLDGLRGVAVILVITFHLWPSVAPGGFAGVDVFFVLSGYLVTTGLVESLEHGAPRPLRDFWSRRARRLLPALLLVLVVGSAAAGIVGGNAELRLGPQAASAITFSNNWYQSMAGVTYFDGFEPPVFQHLWSLAIEEQFYLCWPLILWVLVRGRVSQRRRVQLALALCGASALAMAVGYHPGADPSRLYFGTDTHGFSLMVGALAALWRSRRGGAHQRPTRSTAALRSLAGVLAMLVLAGTAANLAWSSAWTYRGGLALVALVTGVAVLVLDSDGQQWVPDPARAILSSPSLVWAGRRSYGLYLWHWPLAVLAAGSIPPSSPGSAVVRPVVVLAATLLLASLSWRYVEQPVMRHGWGGALCRWTAGGGHRAAVPVRGAVVLVSCVTSSFALAALISSPRTSQAETLIDRGARAVARSQEPTRSTVTPYLPSAAPGTHPERRCLGPGGRNLGSSISLVGDSVSVAAAPALLQTLPGIRIDAHVGMQMWDAAKAVTRLSSTGRLGAIVVLALGTNGDFSERQLRDAISAAGPGHRFVLVTPSGQRPWIPGAISRLRHYAVEHPHHLVVADWDAHRDEVPDFAPDGIHPGPRGGRIFAKLVKQAADRVRCA